MNTNAIDSSLDDSTQRTEKRLLIWRLLKSYLCEVLTLELFYAAHITTYCVNASSHSRFPVIFDSGATHHVLPDNPILSNVRAVSGHPGVRLGNGSVLWIKCIADTPLLEDVLIVPDIQIGLISVSKLAAIEKFTTFAETTCTTIQNKIVVMSGHVEKNLYMLDDQYYRTLISGSDTDYEGFDCYNCLVSEFETHAVSHSYLPGAENELYDIHIRYGHLSENRIKQAIRRGVIKCSISYDKIASQKLPLCVHCYRGRMRKNFQKPTTDHPWTLFQKIAVDYKGPFTIPSVNKYTGFYLFSDYYSNFVAAYPVKSKSEFLSVLKRFNREHNLKKDIPMKKLQSDSDSLAKSAEIRKWLEDNNVEPSLSTPYNKAQNGQIERDMQSVMDKTRTLMMTYDVNPHFWEYALQMACYFINRSPTSRLEDISPLECAFGIKPDFDEMIPFFCPGVYHVTNEERRGPLAEKARLCRMLNYGKVGFIILDVAQNRILHRDSVKFDAKLNINTVQYIISDSDEYQQLLNNITDEPDLTEEPKQVSAESDSDSDSESESDEENEELVESSLDLSPSEIDPQLDESEETVLPPEDVYRRDRLRPRRPRVFSLSSPDPELYSSDVLSDELPSISYTIPLYDSELERLVYQSALVNNLVLPPAPSSIDAIFSMEPEEQRAWIESVNSELKNLEDYGTFKSASQVGHAMKTKCVFTSTFKNDFSIKRKTRLVACGYSQVKGRDYLETFSPTTSVLVVFILLSFAGQRKLFISNFDVKAAFLNGVSDFEQYCRLPAQLNKDNISVRVQLFKSLYGMKQAPKIWSDHCNAVLLQLGFERCPVEPCLYLCHFPNSEFIFICTHVDDGLMISTSEQISLQFIDTLNKFIRDVTLFNPIQKYLGMSITDKLDDSKLSLDLCANISDIEAPTTRTRATTRNIPMSPSINLRLEEKNEKNNSLLPIIGKLRFIADRTRPNILVAVGEISTGGADAPSDAHISVSNQLSVI